MHKGKKSLCWCEWRKKTPNQFLPSREHLETHGTTLQSSPCSSICSSSSIFFAAPLHLLFLFSFDLILQRNSVRYLHPVCWKLPTDWSSRFPPLLLPSTGKSWWWQRLHPAVQGRLPCFAEGLRRVSGALHAVGARASDRWLWHRAGVCCGVLRGGAEPDRIWDLWRSQRKMRRFREGRNLTAEVAPPLFLHPKSRRSLKTRRKQE